MRTRLLFCEIYYTLTGPSIYNIQADVRAAREKNGVYIPHERFAQDEADKKVVFTIEVP